MKVIRLLGVLLLFSGLSFLIMSCSGDSSGGDGDDTQCPAEILEEKQVDFYNTWEPSVTVQIYEYDLACPDVSFLDPSDIAWS
jgi:hypothetical protein